MPIGVQYVCAGCGASVDPRRETPFRCPNANGDDVDHVMVRRSAAEGVAFPEPDHENPFVRYRALLPSYRVAREGGMTDEEFVARVVAIDDGVARVDGHGFRCTPLVSGAGIVAELKLPAGSRLWIKDETGNVAGSHKARHLMEVLLYLDVLEQLDPTRRPAHDDRGLAIASCGNAALAAAVLARATDRPLTVHVPTDAPAKVVQRIRELGARVTVCPRSPGETGDPTMRAFRGAREAGAIPFCCQGDENAMNIDGGKTLAYEVVSSLRSHGDEIDRVFVQIGGGALATACIRGLQEAVALGAIRRMPIVHAVQTARVAPLVRAFAGVRAEVFKRLGGALLHESRDALSEAELSGHLASVDAREAVRSVLEHARTHRSEFMWAWEQSPGSVARSILDDETYDWYAVVAGMIATHGFPLAVSERRLRSVHSLARASSGIPVDATGTAGLAGHVEWQKTAGEQVLGTSLVLFTGLDREAC